MKWRRQSTKRRPFWTVPQSIGAWCRPAIFLSRRSGMLVDMRRHTAGNPPSGSRDADARALFVPSPNQPSGPASPPYIPQNQRVPSVGTHIILTASDGHKLGAYRVDPAGSPKGGIVVIQEIFGVNHHIRSIADRFAALGYVAI